MKNSLYYVRVFICAVAAATVLSLPASAHVWVASTGTPVNPFSIVTNGPTVSLSPSIKTGFTTIRYNVLPVGDLAQPLGPGLGPCREMFVRYRDNGRAAEVVVKLKQMDVRTGAIDTLMTFDSNQNPQGPGLQEGSIPFCENFNFDFADARENVGFHVYRLEASLIRSGAGGDPAISEIRIVTVDL